MKNVIYDLSAILYSGALAGYSSKWCNSVAFPTGGLYKFFNLLFRDIKNGYNVILALDSKPDQSVRREYYPPYKENRAKNRKPTDREKVGLQFEYLTDNLDKLGIAYLKKEGYEADDLIYSLVASHKDTNFLLRADDSDLEDIMMINKLNRMESVSGRGSIYFTKSRLLSKICYGDISDNYPALSIAGIRVVKQMVAENINILMGLPYDKQRLQELTKGNKLLIEEIERNIFLATPKLEYVGEIPETKINEDHAALMLNALGCKSILKRSLKRERDFSSPQVKEELIRLSCKVSPELRQTLNSSKREHLGAEIGLNENKSKDIDWSAGSMDDILKVLQGGDNESIQNR